MSNFHKWVINNHELIKQNIVSVIEEQSIRVSFMGYYIEDNDKSYSMSAKPIYTTIEEYLKDNPNHGVITHIRYFFALKKGKDTHTLTAHIYQRDPHHFLFSIEELAEEFTVSDVSRPKSYAGIIPMLKQKFQPYMEELEQLQGKINAHDKIDSEILTKINYKIRLDWNYYSNRMEGGTLTKPETRQVMLGMSVASKPLNDVKEMSGHDKAVQEIIQVAKGNFRISESRIKNMHKLIMSEDDNEKESLIGEWKQENNEIINYKGEKQVFLPHEEVHDKIHELLNRTNAELDAYLNAKKESRHPLFIAVDFHLDYLYIHPFYDGNGRTARLLTNLILISCGYPPIIITDTYKEVYYRLISEVQTYGADKELFYSFMGERLIDTQRMVLDAIAGKDISDEDDFEKEVELLKNQLGTGDDDIKLEYEDLELTEFLNENILPILKGVVKRGKKLEELFKKVQVSLRLGQKWETTTFTDAEKMYFKLFDGLDSKSTYEFKLDVNLMNFVRNGVNAFSVPWKFQVDFGIIRYTAKCDLNGTGLSWVKQYHKGLTSEEQKQIIDAFGKHVLDEIKRHIK